MTASLGEDDIVVHSDGSQTRDGTGYGYVIHQGGELSSEGYGRMTAGEVFDAEAEGARHGLRAAIPIAESTYPIPTITCAIDSTSAIYGLRGTASDTSQCAFLEHQRLAMGYKGDLYIRWCPAHEGITGNEQADSMAK